MDNHLLFDFSIDKSSKTVNITREFNAERALVWDAFTKKELLDQWGAPEPFKARTKFMDFKVGGKRFYAMVSPEGHERWVLQTYTAIEPKTNFKLYNAFSDENENPEPAGSEWDYTFSEQKSGAGQVTTTVHIRIYNDSLERMERMIEMGFKEGFTMTILNLEKLLTSLK